MTRVILLVHGMGVHGSDWAKDAIAGLTKAAKTYQLDGKLGATIKKGAVAIKTVEYDSQFTQILGRWGNDSRTLADYIAANSLAVPANLISWLNNADNTENNFLWSHVIDVILYRFFSEITTSVRVHVMQQIAQAWKDALDIDSTARVTIVAHSLGTSVAHDSLALLSTKPPQGCDGFLAGDRRLAGIFMVANVSRELETLPQVYDSTIAPPSVRGSNAYTAELFNVHHELDPFTAPRPFKPAWGGNDYSDITTTAIREFNTHSFERYIDDPRFHVPLLRSIFGFDAVSEPASAAAIAAYDAASGPPCPQVLADFVQDCRQRIQIIEDSSDIKTLIAAGVHFLADIEAVRARCK
jgi:pimeloyl-ACP methyl ester carboxylesterase